MTEVDKILERLDDLEALMITKDQDAVSKRIICIRLGLKSRTIDSYVNAGKILKIGNLYSFKAHIEYLKKRRRWNEN